MQISIETNVTSQFAEGYGKYYAKYMQNLHVRIVMTVFLVVIAIPSIYFQELPDPGSDFQEYVFDVMLLGIMLAAIGVIAYLAYQINVSDTTDRMRKFYKQLGFEGNLLIQIGGEELHIKSDDRMLNFHYHNGRDFFHEPYRVRKVYQSPDVLFFLAGCWYFVIPVWDCGTEEWDKLCTFLKKTFGKRYICLKKPVFPNRLDGSR